MIRERDKALATAHDSCIELVARADQVKDLRDPIRALRAQVSDEKRRSDQAHGNKRLRQNRPK